MKKGLLAKRALAFVLAFAMLAGEPIIAKADETTSAKPQKTVGVEVKHGKYPYFFTKANGAAMPYRYVNRTPSVLVKGNQHYDDKGILKKDPETGLFKHNGKYYTSMSYNYASDTTTFSNRVNVINIPEGNNSSSYISEGGYYSIDGKNYTNISTVAKRYFFYTSSDYECTYVRGNVVPPKDEASGFYVYNGKYYRNVSYVQATDETCFYGAVDGYTYDSFPRDEYGLYICGNKKYGTFYYNSGGRKCVEPRLEAVILDERPPINEYGYYVVNGKCYTSCYDRNGKYVCYYERTPIGFNKYMGNFKDDKRKTYCFNGKYYYSYYMDSLDLTYYVNDPVIIVKSGIICSDNTSESQALGEAKLPYLRRADGTTPTTGSYDYVEYGGKYYKNIYSYYLNIRGEYRGYIYVKPEDEIEFKDASCPSVSWADVPVLNDKLTSEGNEVKVYYQLEVDGKTVKDSNPLRSSTNFEAILYNDSFVYATSSTSAELAPIDPDKSVKVRVRALFCAPYKYTYKTGFGTNSVERLKVVSVGAWSDSKTYTNKIVKKIKPSGFSAALSGNYVDVKWTPNTKSITGEIVVVSSDEPIEGINASNYSTYAKQRAPGYYSVYTLTTSYMDGLYSFARTSTAFKRQHNYFAMRYTAAAEGYRASQEFTNVVYVKGIKDEQLPDITGLKVQKSTSSVQSVSWDVKSSAAKVVVYAYTGKSLPKYFDAYIKDYTTVGGTKLYLNLLGKDASNFRKIYYATANLTAGSITLSSFKNYKGETLEPGTKYKFVAYSYDTTSYNEERTPLVYNNMEFVHYNSVGKASSVITATYNTVSSGVTTVTTDNSVKLSFGTDVTGHVIYKKNAKGKFEKIVTTTNNSYTDTKLTKGKKYTYRVYNYTYDEITKKKVVSQKYITISATPGTVNNFEVLVSQEATNKVKLSWTKVPGATSYEIYKSLEKGDTTVSNPSSSLNDAYELVKTIKNAKTVSTTDSFDAGAECYYKVVAKYKVAGKQFEVSASDYIIMDLTAPERVKTSLSKGTAKISWIANKFAKGYEVHYTIYDKYGNAQTKQDKVATTTKNSISIKNIPSGGYVKVKVSAYDAKGHNTSYVSATAISSLAASESISASYVAKEKAIKVSWKAVKGAKYYRVYRSTTEAKYDECIKAYVETGNDIEAEGIKDGGATYHQYAEIANSITKTTVYDRAKLMPGVRYYYTVVAYGEKQTVLASKKVTENSSRNYNSTVYISPKPASVVYAPYSIKISSVASTGGNSITVKYNKVTNATSYKIYRSTKKSSGFKLVGTSKTTTFKDTKIPKEGTYYYKVEAATINGLQADYVVKSAVKEFKYTKKPATPKIKSVVAAKDKGKVQITIKWDKVKDATGYAVYRSTSKNGKYTKIATIKKNATVSYVDKDKKLKAKTVYYYKIVAYRTVNKTTTLSGESNATGTGLLS